VNKEDLQQRTKRFALAILRLTETLPTDRAASVLGRQLLRAATSVGANYRAACRARSRADFVAKLGLVEEEADETRYWLELLLEAGLISHDAAAPLLQEAAELVAITVASIKTARQPR
jgi:four helix bundle protein